MAPQPDFADDVYASMVTKRSSMLIDPVKMNRASTVVSEAGNRSSKAFSVKSGSSGDSSTKKKSKRDSMMSMMSSSENPKIRKTLPDGTPLGRPIDGIQYIKGSYEEKIAQINWTNAQLQKIF